MRIWKLAPTDRSNSIWKKWSPEPIIVRAETEAEARHLALLKTIKTFPTVPWHVTPVNPWSGHRKIGDPSPTLCVDVTEQTVKYSVDGPAEVLLHGEQF